MITPKELEEKVKRGLTDTERLFIASNILLCAAHRLNDDKLFDFASTYASNSMSACINASNDPEELEFIRSIPKISEEMMGFTKEESHSMTMKIFKRYQQVIADIIMEITEDFKEEEKPFTPTKTIEVAMTKEEFDKYFNNKKEE